MLPDSQQELLDQLKSDVREGLDELDRGEGLPFDAERIRVEVARRLVASVG